MMSSKKMEMKMENVLVTDFVSVWSLSLRHVSARQNAVWVSERTTKVGKEG